MPGRVVVSIDVVFREAISGGASPGDVHTIGAPLSKIVFKFNYDRLNLVDAIPREFFDHGFVLRGVLVLIDGCHGCRFVVGSLRSVLCRIRVYCVVLGKDGMVVSFLFIYLVYGLRLRMQNF